MKQHLQFLSKTQLCLFTVTCFGQKTTIISLAITILKNS